MKIAIVGAAGRMGKMLCKLAEGTDLEVVSRVDVAEGYDREWRDDVEGVIDFSFHAALPGAIAKAAEQGIAYVIGTTGVTAEEQQAVDEAAKKIPVVQSGNYSLGVNLLLELVKKAASVLGPQYDIEVTEMHHRHKKDAPSGTALMLADAIKDTRDKTEYVYDRHSVRKKRETSEIGIHSVRGGTIVGEHEVLFAGTNEVISLTHSAGSREIFATGALRAAAYVAGKSAGLYNMSDLINNR